MGVLDVVQPSIDRGATSVLCCSLCPALGKGSEVAPAVAGRQQRMGTNAAWRLCLGASWHCLPSTASLQQSREECVCCLFQWEWQLVPGGLTV